LRDQLCGHLGLGHSGEVFLRANGGFEQGGDEEHRNHRGHEPPPDGFPGVCRTEAQDPCHGHMRQHLHQSGPPSAQPFTPLIFVRLLLQVQVVNASPCHSARRKIFGMKP
jgi:hypothetical protein